ncbi:MAG: DUF1638 domain-containing protein [Candidatus Omnitrophica bacterium]|nr:DUF1638 domain-containing protein [Candidatus Omnitrophota bacterium]
MKLIACEVVYREVCLCVALSRNIVDVTFITQGLHDLKQEGMVVRLQKEIDSVDETKYEAILLGYGLCNNGIAGLRANKIKIVAPRAHDCITLFLGSKERYQEYFAHNPGTYFETTGWIERDNVNMENVSQNVHRQLGIANYEEYVRQYGEENAKYLLETLGDWTKNYRKYAYIDMDGGLPVYGEDIKAKAKEKNWEYERIKGDMRLIKKMIDGEWGAEDFLIVPPGQQIVATHDGSILAASG